MLTRFLRRYWSCTKLRSIICRREITYLGRSDFDRFYAAWRHQGSVFPSFICMAALFLSPKRSERPDDEMREKSLYFQKPHFSGWQDPCLRGHRLLSFFMHSQTPSSSLDYPCPIQTY